MSISRLYHLLKEADAEGRRLSLAELALATGQTIDEVRQMLEILLWEGKVKEVVSAGCGVEGQGCDACPLNKVCTRGVSHKRGMVTLTIARSPTE